MVFVSILICLKCSSSISDSIPLSEDEKIDRTIVNIPDNEHLVLIYNKFREEQRLLDKEEYFQKHNYVLKPLAIIPEKNLEIYSRCIACRTNVNGELESLQESDYGIIFQYLAK